MRAPPDPFDPKNKIQKELGDDDVKAAELKDLSMPEFDGDLQHCVLT
jgi:hypothetical protein